MTAPEHILLVMVDGLGKPPAGEPVSIYQGLPAIRRLFRYHTTWVDASLGVPGIPQSATGQTAILTGVNAAAILGQHLPGFPNARLRTLVEQDNIFHRLNRAGKSCVFANAYARFGEQQLPLYLRSVTTVATLSAFHGTRTRDDLILGQAVYHDLTRATLRHHGQTDIPEITEEEAARHLLGIVNQHAFTLFEYFLTDHVGHRGTGPEKRAILASLDSFLGALCDGIDRRRQLLLMISDHGNIEGLDTRRHTCNPVPFCAVGCGARHARTTGRTILDVTPTVLQLLGVH